MATAPTESPMNRFRVGDIVQYSDNSTWPPTVLVGEIIAFTNDVGSYLSIEFPDDDIRERTEEEVTRIA